MLVFQDVEGFEKLENLLWLDDPISVLVKLVVYVFEGLGQTTDLVHRKFWCVRATNLARILCEPLCQLIRIQVAVTGDGEKELEPFSLGDSAVIVSVKRSKQRRSLLDIVLSVEVSLEPRICTETFKPRRWQFEQLSF